MEKRLNSFNSNRIKNSTKIRFSVHFLVYFWIIFANLPVLRALTDLCKKKKNYDFRFLNLSGFPLNESKGMYVDYQFMYTLLILSLRKPSLTKLNKYSV
jgi:hypothetical protein